MNKQNKVMMKPLGQDNSSKLLKKLFPLEISSINRKQKKNMTTSMNNMDQYVDENNSDNSDDDTSSISSIESDCYEINVWDNSELRLRDINTEQFTDQQGNELSFLQLYKTRSLFYKKKMPQLSDIFKDAERIHKFCGQKLTLHDFLEDEVNFNLQEIELYKDKNFCKFSRYFEQQLDLNRQKLRDEQYDRYNTVSIKSFDSPDSCSSRIQGRESVLNRNNDQMLSSINLSPLKPQQKRLIFNAGKDVNSTNNLRKTQLNLLQRCETSRNQKVKISQQKPKQDQQLQQISSQENNAQYNNQSLFSIPDMEVYDNSASTSVSQNQMSNSSCESQQDYQFKMNNNNHSNQRLFKMSESSYSSSPIFSPNSITSLKFGSPITNQKSPNMQQNEFRLKLQNTNEVSDGFSICNGEDNFQKSQYMSQNSSNKQTPYNNKQSEKVYGMSSFTNFLSSNQSQNKRSIMNQSIKSSTDLTNMSKQNNLLMNSTYLKSNQQNQQQQRLQQNHQFNNKSNLNSSSNEVKFPTLDKTSADNKQMQINNQSNLQSENESPSLIQNYIATMSPLKKPQTPFQQGTILTQSSLKSQQQKNNFQRVHRKFQSTVVNESQQKKLAQLINSKF